MNNVILTKVQIFRNVKDYKFEPKLSVEHREEIVAKLEEVLKNKMSKLDVTSADAKVVKYLKGNRLVSNNSKTIFVGKEDNVAIKMFEGEHLVITSTIQGYEKSVINKAIEMSQFLSNKISFAFNDELGFLMSDLSKIGSGLKIEAEIMLSAITSINKIDQVKRNIQNLGYSLKETNYPAIYTLSTTCNLGVGEKQICEDFEKTLLKLQDLEIESVKMLDVSNHDEIVDKTRRSWALLNSAYLLNYDELYNMLVNLRFGLNLDLIQIEEEKLNKLQQLIQEKNNDFISQSELKELAQKVQKILKGE